MALLNIKPETYERLKRKAVAQNTTVENLVEPVLEQLANGESSVEERRKAFDDWMALVHQRADRYPADFVADDSRESIYEGRGE